VEPARREPAHEGLTQSFRGARDQRPRAVAFDERPWHYAAFATAAASPSGAGTSRVKG